MYQCWQADEIDRHIMRWVVNVIRDQEEVTKETKKRGYVLDEDGLQICNSCIHKIQPRRGERAGKTETARSGA